jgi:DNA polymerase-1
MDTEAPAEVQAPDAPAAPLHLVLVDGSGFIFRAFHALPPMSRPDGTPVNAVFGFTNMIAKLLRDHVGTHIAVIFDAGRTTFRNRMYPEYKAQRPDPAPEIIPQFALVRDATAAFGLPSIELADWEADDLIASYVREACARDGRVTIVSSDKDLMQLIRPGVLMHDPIKQKPIGPPDVMEKFGVTPDKMVEVQALIGDSVDNVPGVPGIGPKNAAQLIAEFGDLEHILAAAPAMKPSKRRDMLIAHAEAARLSRELVRLRDDVPLPVPLDDLAAREPDPERLGAWLGSMGFRSVLARLGLQGGDGPSVTMDHRPAAVPEAEAAPPAAAPFGPYETIIDPARLAEFLVDARAGGILAVHPLTDGRDLTRAGLVGIGLATAPGRAAYVPLGHQSAGELDTTAPAQMPQAEALAAIGPLLDAPDILVVAHDAKYGLAVVEQAGAPAATPVDDVMLISYAGHAGEHGHGLHELSRLHLGHSMVAADEVTGTGRGRSMRWRCTSRPTAA